MTQQTSIVVACTACGQQNRVPRAKAGAQGKCGKCKAALPAPSHPLEVEHADELRAVLQGSKLPVLVDFWASWCGPCRKELPGLDALQKHAGDKILKVIAVNVKDSTEDYRLMMRQMKDYTISMTRDRSGEIAEGYGVKAYPNLWIIDPQGKVAAHHVGYGEDSLEALVNQINQVIVAEQQRQKAAAAASAAG